VITQTSEWRGNGVHIKPTKTVRWKIIIFKPTILFLPQHKNEIVRKDSTFKAIISVFITGGANCPKYHFLSVTKNINGPEKGHFAI
jgi:hypothetical protein